MTKYDGNKRRSVFFITTAVLLGILLVAGAAFYFFDSNAAKEKTSFKGTQRTSKTFAKKETDKSNSEVFESQKTKPKQKTDSHTMNDGKKGNLFSDGKTNELDLYKKAISIAKRYLKEKKIAKSMNFSQSFYTEKNIRKDIISLKGCGIPKANVFGCMKCHGEYGQKSAMGVSKPIILISAPRIYKSLKEYKEGKKDLYGKGNIMTEYLNSKKYTDCDLKALANQIKGL